MHDVSTTLDTGGGGGVPTAYLGPYPIRGPSLAEVDGMTSTLIIDDPDNGGSESGAYVLAGFANETLRQAQGERVEEKTFSAEIGCAAVSIYHNGYLWVMRFAERNRCNRLTFGEDVRQLARLGDAFDRALYNFHSLSPILMVAGVAFNVAEARAMRELLADVCGATRSAASGRTVFAK